MEKEFVPYKQALKLKKLGFNEPCFGKYDINGSFYFSVNYHNTDIQSYCINCSAPLYQQAFKWLFKQLNIKGVMYFEEKQRLIALKNLIKKVKHGTSSRAL